MNKYQEALDTIVSIIGTEWEALDTLQELIDNYSNLSELEVDYNNLLSSTSLEIEKLEKENKGLRDSCELKLATALAYKREREILEKALYLQVKETRLNENDEENISSIIKLRLNEARKELESEKQ